MWNLLFSFDYSLCMRFPFCIRATNTVDSCKRTEVVLVKKIWPGNNRPRGTRRQHFWQGRRLQMRGKGTWKDCVRVGRWNFTKAEIAHWGSKRRDSFLLYHLMEKNPAGFWGQLQKNRRNLMQCCLMKREYVMLMVRRCTRKIGSVSVYDDENESEIISGSFWHI